MEKRIPPLELVLIQEQFGKLIRTPFSFSTGRFQSRIDRLVVYNEQYWYRLMTVLQQDFPLLAGTMGLWKFNQLATAFLDQHPSRSPYLQNLPNGFVEFLKTSVIYNTPQLIQIAALEIAMLNAFHAPVVFPLDPSKLSPRELEILADTSLVFQPCFSLLEEDWNLMECRTALEEKKNEVPIVLDRKGYWAVFRNGNDVEWKELDPIPFHLLNRLRAGQPLGLACEAVAENLDSPEVNSLMSKIPSWFETWTRLKWFEQPSFESLINGDAEVI